MILQYQSSSTVKLNDIFSFSFSFLSFTRRVHGHEPRCAITAPPLPSSSAYVMLHMTMGLIAFLELPWNQVATTWPRWAERAVNLVFYMPKHLVLELRQKDDQDMNVISGTLQGWGIFTQSEAMATAACLFAHCCFTSPYVSSCTTGCSLRQVGGRGLFSCDFQLDIFFPFPKRFWTSQYFG